MTAKESGVFRRIDRRRPRWACFLACLVLASQAHAGELLPTSVRLPPSGHANSKLGMLSCDASRSVARAWDEQLLAAIRLDSPRPTVHTRNLFHVSLAMYDTWAAYDPVAQPYLTDESASVQGQSASDRDMAISFAAYRVLVDRFASSPGAATSLARFATCMQSYGYDPAQTGTSGSAPSAIGNRVAAAVIAYALADQSNQPGNYVDTTGYIPTNNPMLVALPGTGGLADINAWQPLIPPGAPGVQSFLTPHWRFVTPFSLVRPGPGMPYISLEALPKLGGIGHERVREDILQVIRYSSRLDPDDGVMLNISPRLRGNSPLGTNSGTGYPVNPVTGVPYADNFALRGDWGRVLGGILGRRPVVEHAARALERDCQCRVGLAIAGQANSRGRPGCRRPRVGHQALHGP